MVTMSETVVVCVSVPLVAVTVSAKVPSLVPLLKVRTEAPELSDVGLSVAVGPPGATVTPSVTVPLKPPLGAIDTE